MKAQRAKARRPRPANGNDQAASDARWTKGRIVALRKRLGLSQQAFAERLGLHVGTVGKWEMSAREVRPSRLAMRRLDELAAGGE